MLKQKNRMIWGITWFVSLMAMTGCQAVSNAFKYDGPDMVDQRKIEEVRRINCSPGYKFVRPGTAISGGGSF